MNRDAIVKTAVCYWSEEDGCFLVESPLFDRVVGNGETPQAAWVCFRQMLKEALESIQKYGLYEAPGRPAKGTVGMHIHVQPRTRDAIKAMQESLSAASQGEVIDYLVFYYQHTPTSRPPSTTGAEENAADTMVVAESAFSTEICIFGVNIKLTRQQVDAIRARLNRDKTRGHGGGWV
ncbi:MAG TPA: hypothetical protein V6D08_21480 [Candidatus Obscuribacterales bacterium]